MPLDNAIVMISLELQFQVSSLMILLPRGEVNLNIGLGAAEMLLFLDQLCSMFLKEYAMKDCIASDLRVEVPSQTLGTYITAWRSKPHLDEIAIENFKQKLALHDQMKTK